MEWYVALLIIWAAGLTVCCLFFYGAYKNSRRCFCPDCGSWWEFCQCQPVLCPACKATNIGTFGAGSHVCLDCHHVWVGEGQG